MTCGQALNTASSDIGTILFQGRPVTGQTAVTTISISPRRFQRFLFCSAQLSARARCFGVVARRIASGLFRGPFQIGGLYLNLNMVLKRKSHWRSFLCLKAMRVSFLTLSLKLARASHRTRATPVEMPVPSRKRCQLMSVFSESPARSSLSRHRWSWIHLEDGW